MGKYKKPRGLDIKENPNMMAGQTKMECYNELNRFFECMGKANFEIDYKCARESAELMACAEAAAKKPKTSSTINHHLQRLSRVLKKR